MIVRRNKVYDKLVRVFGKRMAYKITVAIVR